MMGETVGGYRLVRKLGEGGLGEVYLGEHGQNHPKKAAVKILFPPFSKEGTALTRYFAEVRSTNLFGHPGIAQVYDCGTHSNGRAYLCMEYLPGKSLAAALGDLENVSEVTTLATIGGQIAGALKIVHSKRMVHRALKTDSIFMTSPAPYPVIKLLDFGVANFTQSVRHSQTGSLLGAPLYMSPEVGRGMGNVDHRADIYSLGCILFEMATGRPPFVREGAGELVVAHATEAAPAARTLEPSIPAELDELIGRSLRKDPAQRPQSMSEVAAVLARFARLEPLAQAPALPQTVVQPTAVQAPLDTPCGATTSDPLPRRLEPTALLSQPTALFDPPCGPGAIREVPLKRVARAAPTAVQKSTPSPPVLSLPLVAVGSGIVLSAVAIAYFLFAKKPPMAQPDRASPSRSAAPMREEFRPPPPVRLPPPEGSPSPGEGAARPTANRAQPTQQGAKAEVRPQASKSPPSDDKSAPAMHKEVPLW